MRVLYEREEVGEKSDERYLTTQAIASKRECPPFSTMYSLTDEVRL